MELDVKIARMAWCSGMSTMNHCVFCNIYDILYFVTKLISQTVNKCSKGSSFSVKLNQLLWYRSNIYIYILELDHLAWLPEITGYR
jgi:hypothetical protein